MKKIILIALTLMLTLGILSALALAASASGADGKITVPAPPEDPTKVTVTLGELGLDYDTIWNAFPYEIEQSYQDGVFYVTDAGFTDVVFWSYLNYQNYQLTLIDGKWQVELPKDVYQRGGLVYGYADRWYTVYRGGTIEAVLFEGKDPLGNDYMLEVMWDLFRIYSIRVIDDVTYSLDAYYTPDGSLDYLSVSGSVEGCSLTTIFNAQREATEISSYLNEWIYLSPDGNWYSSSDFDSEICTAPAKFDGMSFAEIAALNPCFIECGDHKPSEISCENDQVCTVCYTLLQKASGHNWTDATCTDPAICKICNQTGKQPIGHSEICNITEPDCVSNGYTTYTCITCGYEYTSDETEPTGHNWQDATCTSPNLCTNCGETQGEPLDHLYEAAVTAPDCYSGGYTTYTCECGDEYVANETQASGHSYEATITPPDCDQGGHTSYLCTACGDAYVGDHTDPTGHDWADATTEAPQTCLRCGETNGEPLAPTENPEQSEATEQSENSEESSSAETDSAAAQSTTENLPTGESQSTVALTTNAQIDARTPTATDGESSPTARTNPDASTQSKASGCGAVIGALAAIITLSIGIPLAFKKKEDA